MNKPKYQTPEIDVQDLHLFMADVLALSDASGSEDEWNLDE